MSATLTEKTTIDGQTQTFLHRELQYYQLGQKERVDSKHLPESKVDDLLKEHVSKWVFTGDKTLSHLEGTTLCSVSVPEDYGKLATHILQQDGYCPSFRTYMEEIQYEIDRFDPALDNFEVSTITLNSRKVLQITRTTMRGGKGIRTWTVDPLRGYEVVKTKLESYLRDGRLWFSVQTDYSLAEVAPGAWRVVGCKLEARQLETDKDKWIEAQEFFETTSYEANTGKIDESYFTFEGLGVPAGTLIADLTFDPPIEYYYKTAPFSEADLEAVWSNAHKSPGQNSADANALLDDNSAPRSDANGQPNLADNPTQGAAFPSLRLILAAAVLLTLAFTAGFFLKTNKHPNNKA
ncbi:MAG: hypothetical protein JSU94_14430 [Phycisphaerales bacterium]|nr:MAG: hypothetical protein JSU94_14430 [Phycisphaerales bacterium]